MAGITTRPIDIEPDWQITVKKADEGYILVNLQPLNDCDKYRRIYTVCKDLREVKGMLEMFFGDYPEN